MSLKQPRTEILRGRNRFKEIYSDGDRLVGDYVACYYKVRFGENTKKNQFLVGFSVSNRFLKAVGRNRMKRLMREAYRHERGVLEKIAQTGAAVSIIFSAKERIKVVPSYNGMRKDIETILKHIVLDVGKRK